ncbi:Wzy polymerase domain-containing protein [Undibacterium sp. RTI2.1]|uniref:PglL family O-oligosaccharyltransferase n=2 Tax=Pseudomonadota TaxID=1224 RepID=UPI002AB39D18|nr:MULTISPECIES: Wzy polymerase domain-containing protein [unclassified Undibacterium]MDY7538768.1 Wzy polymerase domain-containing protein [Undibacterium sp. 5I1]MEB0032916.1 Wzy polymerase domain-containing protein [Undibacterium sp. RTI2.1]MEB0118245.1 Wzy polymerase domain-containing protein [Undibacterium sp. RTI2.2]MEB0229707.1 Wzy polymerase domain-containing protein [Undibacterium sp. 10I3]MEB0258428.1 Wzy polymerase domain-containing protein [Undibacterium sp. 5I1]
MKITTKLSLAIFALLLLVSYIHPHHVHPYRTYYHDFLTIFGLLVLSVGILIATTPRLSFPQLLLIPILLIGFVFLQLTGNVASSLPDTLIPLLYIALIAVAFIIGATFAIQTQYVELICLSFAIAHLLAGLLSVIMQLVQITGIDATPAVMFIARESQPFMRPYANVAQPNQLALLFCFSLASVWYLYQRRFFNQWASVLLVLVLLIGLALTQSRIGWMIVPAFALVCMFKTQDGHSVSRWFLAVLVLLYAALVFGLPIMGQHVGFASGSVAEHIGGRSERMVLMQQAWHMATQHPWLGVGWFGFGAEQVRIAADFGSTTYAEHSHNLILNLAAELGFPATILICSGLAWWAVQCFFIKAVTVPIRFAGLFFVAVFVHSMVEFPLWYAFVLIPVGILMGMVHQLRWPSEGVLLGRPAKSVIAVILGGAFLFMALITWDYQRVTTGFRVLRWQQSGYVVDISPSERPAFTLFPQFFDYFKLTKMVAREGMSDTEIAFAERLSHRFGYVHVLSKMAEVYTLNGKPEQAARTMQTLQRLHPISYPEYYDYWKAQAALDARYEVVFKTMPARDAQ